MMTFAPFGNPQELQDQYSKAPASYWLQSNLFLKLFIYLSAALLLPCVKKAARSVIHTCKPEVMHRQESLLRHFRIPPFCRFHGDRYKRIKITIKLIFHFDLKIGESEVIVNSTKKQWNFYIHFAWFAVCSAPEVILKIRWRKWPLCETEFPGALFMRGAGVILNVVRLRVFQNVFSNS